MSSTYKQITATAMIKPAAGKLKGLFVSAASSTPTVTIYDSAMYSTSDPKILDTFTPVAGTNHNFYDGIYAKNGLYVVITGTVSATIAFE